MKVLVAEKLADSGIEALREHFEVDLGYDWSAEDLAARIGETTESLRPEEVCGYGSVVATTRTATSGSGRPRSSTT